MEIVLVLVVIAVAIALGGLAVYAMRSSGQAAQQQASARATAPARRPMPPVDSFHVHGETASVVFDVPLGDSEAGAHLTELLAANAIEFVREKVEDGQPLEGVHRIAVSAKRGDSAEELTTVDLPEVGALPEESPILARDPDAHDPIAAVAAVVADASVSTPTGRSDTLDPVADIVELSSPTEAHLRMMGVDPATMSLSDLGVGFLQASGYTVEAARSGFSMPSLGADQVYAFSRGADRGYLAIVPHTAGEYPELDEKILSEFSIAVAQANPTRAILMSDKFSPYAMYERERRDKRLVFVTRERLQSFVDSFDAG